MTAKTKFRELTQEEQDALAALKAEHGKKWKDTLSMVYWYNARIWRGPQEGMGGVLHAIRNEFGPSWLEAYKG